MDEKTMVSDALVGVNGELKMFGDMIPQTENKELKQCLKQIRNQCEMSQEKLYQVAREKSYYGRRFLQPLYFFFYSSSPFVSITRRNHAKDFFL